MEVSESRPLQSQTLERWSKLSPEERLRLRELAATALDLPLEQRSIWIEQASLEGNMQDVLRRLVNTEEISGDLITTDFLFKIVRQPAALPDEIIDEWVIVERIGAGGMGEVFKAKRADTNFEQIAALKLMRRLSTSDWTVARFRAEIRYLARVGQLIDAGQTKQGRMFLVTKYAGKGKLLEYSDANQLTLRRRLEYFTELCELVDHVHRENLIHCDIKPDNVLVGDDEQVHLVDFGIARLRDQNTAQDTSIREWGTPRYRAPEQQSVRKHLSLQADVYSLGRLLEEFVMGELARRENVTSADWVPLAKRMTGARAEAVANRRGTTAKELNRLLRGELDALLIRAMAFDAEKRHQSASALGKEADRIRKTLPDPDLEFGALLRRMWLRSGVAGSCIAAGLLALSFLAGFLFGRQ